MCHTPFLLSQEYWRCKLSDKFRNSRKGRDRDVPCVIANRKRINDIKVAKKEEKQMPKSTPYFGMKNYLPSKPVSEDEASFEKHRLNLLHESKKKKWSYRTVDQLMALTFYDRRHKIVQEGRSLSDIHEDYPCLFDSQQVRLSMN